MCHGRPFTKHAFVWLYAASNASTFPVNSGAALNVGRFAKNEQACNNVEVFDIIDEMDKKLWFVRRTLN